MSEKEEESLIGRLKQSKTSLAGRFSRPNHSSIYAAIQDRKWWDDMSRKFWKLLEKGWKELQKA